MSEFVFTNELDTPALVGSVIDVLRRPRLWVPTQRDYPRHNEWLERTEADLVAGRKRAMVCLHNRRPAAAVVYRRNPEQPSIVDIRNISVAPESSGRLVGSFLVTQAIREAVEHDYPEVTEVKVDTKITNQDMLDFLRTHGFTPEEITDLYHDGTGLDVVLTRPVPALMSE